MALCYTVHVQIQRNNNTHAAFSVWSFFVMFLSFAHFSI